MAAPVDQRKADKLAKKAKKNRQNYESLSSLKKAGDESQFSGPNAFGYFDYQVSDTWVNARSPMVIALEKCGYHDIMLVHLATGARQAASYDVTKQDQVMYPLEAYKVYSTDESGFLITDDESEYTKTTNDKTTIDEIFKRGVSDSEAQWRSLSKVLFNGTKWTVKKKTQKKGMIGTSVGACAKVRRIPHSEGWTNYMVGTAMCWQQIDSDGNPIDGTATYTPQVNVEVGSKYYVTKDKTFFYNAMGPHDAYYSNDDWDNHQRDVLGFQCTVDSIEEDGHIATVKIVHDEDAPDQIKTRYVATECLTVEDEADTCLFISQVGQYALIAQADLFPSKGYNPRSTNFQVVASEWDGFLQQLSELEETGYFEVDEDDSLLHPSIKAWQKGDGADFDFDP
jgi:hypothetical protein